MIATDERSPVDRAAALPPAGLPPASSSAELPGVPPAVGGTMAPAPPTLPFVASCALSGPRNAASPLGRLAAVPPCAAVPLLAASLLHDSREGDADGCCIDDAPDAVEQLEFVREVGRFADHRPLLALLRSSPFLDDLSRGIFPLARTLSTQDAVTSSDLHTKHKKFAVEGDSIQLAFGGLDSFYAGLEGIVGSPYRKVEAGMSRDRCDESDADKPFKTTNS